ncbi:hypothetical protein ACFV14_14875 [Streptomyces zaomyceticus]|uniref:hypothetical protein n=1 Tax=Streptomyces zaomyceticus TaxID=68286 RepID=UPI0036B9DD36
MRKLATAVVAAGLFFGGMGVAVADSDYNLIMRTPGVAFVGNYAWQPTTKVPSGLHVEGELRDESDNDGHNVYLRVKVEEYAWGELRGIQRGDLKVNKVYTDGAVLKTKQVRMQVCLDRGSLRPDHCSKQRLFSRK